MLAYKRHYLHSSFTERVVMVRSRTSVTRHAYPTYDREVYQKNFYEGLPSIWRPDQYRGLGPRKLWAFINFVREAALAVPYAINTGISGHAFTWPGSRYIGPGNKLNEGRPKSYSDRRAYVHDHQYDQLFKVGVNPYFTFNEADRQMIRDSDLTTPEGWAEYLGMKAKQFFLPSDTTPVDSVPTWEYLYGPDAPVLDPPPELIPQGLPSKNSNMEITYDSFGNETVYDPEVWTGWNAGPPSWELEGRPSKGGFTPTAAGQGEWVYDEWEKFVPEEVTPVTKNTALVTHGSEKVRMWWCAAKKKWIPVGEPCFFGKLTDRRKKYLKRYKK